MAIRSRDLYIQFLCFNRQYEAYHYESRIKEYQKKNTNKEWDHLSEEKDMKTNDTKNLNEKIQKQEKNEIEQQLRFRFIPMLQQRRTLHFSVCGKKSHIEFEE